MRLAIGSLLFALAASSIPGLARAQRLATGTWSGSITDPSGNVKLVSYMVAGTGDSLSIALFDPAVDNSIPFTDVRQVGDTIFFAVAAGPNGGRLVGKVVRQADGSYEGTGTDSAGRHGSMRMIPPTKP